MSSFINKFALLAVLVIATDNVFVDATSYEYIYYERSCGVFSCGSWRATDYRWCVEGVAPLSQYGPMHAWDEDVIARNGKQSSADCEDRDE